MKKTFLLMSAVLLLASCTTIKKTAKTIDSPAQLLSATVADLNVAKDRVSLTYHPTKSVMRGGLGNAYKVAERKLLDEQGGGADVLVDPEYTVEKTNYIFFTKVDAITVSGRPATYKNFRSLDDKVWCDPVFRNSYSNGISKGSTGIKGLFSK